MTSVLKTQTNIVDGNDSVQGEDRVTNACSNWQCSLTPCLIQEEDSPPPMYDHIIPRTVTEVWEGPEGSEMKENEVYGLEQRGNIS